MRGRPTWMVAMQLPAAKRRLALSRLARRHPNAPMRFVDELGRMVLLTRDLLNRTRWRATWFDLDEQPCGHGCATTHREGLAVAVEYGARLESCQVLGGAT